jgi:hypothetical protein
VTLRWPLQWRFKKQEVWAYLLGGFPSL